MILNRLGSYLVGGPTAWVRPITGFLQVFGEEKELAAPLGA